MFFFVTKTVIEISSKSQYDKIKDCSWISDNKIIIQWKSKSSLPAIRSRPSNEHKPIPTPSPSPHTTPSTARPTKLRGSVIDFSQLAKKVEEEEKEKEEHSVESQKNLKKLKSVSSPPLLRKEKQKQNMLNDDDEKESLCSDDDDSCDNRNTLKIPPPSQNWMMMFLVCFKKKWLCFATFAKIFWLRWLLNVNFFRTASFFVSKPFQPT